MNESVKTNVVHSFTMKQPEKVELLAITTSPPKGMGRRLVSFIYSSGFGRKRGEKSGRKFDKISK